MFIKLSKFKLENLDFLSKKNTNINDYLLKYKFKKIKVLKNIVEKFKSDKIILFCTGSYTKVILKSFNGLGTNISIIIDNNIHNRFLTFLTHIFHFR